MLKSNLIRALAMMAALPGYAQWQLIDDSQQWEDGDIFTEAADTGWRNDDVLGWCYPATDDNSTWTLFLEMGWYYRISGENGDWLWSTLDQWCYTNAIFYPWFWMEAKDLWRRLDYDAYFLNLQPDVTMETVLKEFGEDDADIEDMLVYATNSGEYELTFADGNLYWGNLIYSGGGSRRIYSEHGDDDSESAVQEREAWVAAGEFADAPDWIGKRVIYTSAYQGRIYPLSEAYVRIDAFFYPYTRGQLSDKSYLVSIIQNGHEEILYRAFDVWETLSGPYTLAEAEASQAAIVDKFQKGEEILNDGSTPLLLMGDTGSGVIRHLYYIPAGLIIVDWDEGFDSATLSWPGYEKYFSLKEWALAQ